MDTETFYLVEVPGGDRRYIQRSMTPEDYKKFKAQKEGTRIFKVQVTIPLPNGVTHDHHISAVAEEA
jgi:hypothetical protein